VELNFLSRIFDNDGPDIIGVYGIAGIGKSTLMNRFIALSQTQCWKIDCQLCEPTPKAFLSCVMGLVDCESAELNTIAAKIKPGTILILDQFELFGLLESWLRREFMPVMKGRLNLIFSGRLHPDNQWLLNPPEEMRFCSLRLNSLSFNASIEYLQSQGHTKVVALGINQFANGHPLALKLASSAILEQPDRQLNEVPPNNVIQALAYYFIEDIKSPVLRQALEATSVVRRINEPLLLGMLDMEPSSELYRQLSEVALIEYREDGLSFHEVLKNALSSNLKARSPQKYNEYRNKASRILQQEMKSASASQLWRYTADIIYLVDNSLIRNAFFPPDDVRKYSVEPAQACDQDVVMSIIRQFEPQSCVGIYQRWWQHYIQTFHCVKNNRNEVVGFYCLINPSEVSAEALQSDPVSAAWTAHLSTMPRLNQQQDQTLFIRRWLSAKSGESLSGVQAACWLDIKRKYLEMKPNLRHVYLTLRDIQPYALVATELGFKVENLEINIDGCYFYTGILDLGPDSVDGWIAKRLVHEIKQEASEALFPDWFDKKARQILVHEQRVDLTPLEYGTLELLITNRGVAISRKELLKEVWDIHYEGASNVVDTVILSLRKKLDNKSVLIQSVRGTGYRYISGS